MIQCFGSADKSIDQLTGTKDEEQGIAVLGQALEGRVCAAVGIAETLECPHGEILCEDPSGLLWLHDQCETSSCSSEK